jgi:hypothetical protein
MIAGAIAGDGRRADGPDGAMIGVGALGAIRAGGGGDGAGARDSPSAHPLSNKHAKATLRNTTAGRNMARERIRNVIAKYPAKRSEGRPVGAAGRH